MKRKKQTNRRGFRQYSIARKFLFMRCICIWLGKVAGAWIWLQTIIKCGDNECNEWGYLSKPLHAHWAFKGPSRRKLRTVSTKTGFKCRTIKVKRNVDDVKCSWSNRGWTRILGRPMGVSTAWMTWPSVGRLRLKCYGTCAETRFRLSTEWSIVITSAMWGGGSVQSTTGTRAVHISLQGLYCSCKPVFCSHVTHNCYLLRYLVFPSLPQLVRHRVQITFQLDSSKTSVRFRRHGK